MCVGFVLMWDGLDWTELISREWVVELLRTIRCPWKERGVCIRVFNWGLFDHYNNY